MRVEELFKKEHLSISFIDENFDGPYWEKVSNFVIDNWTRDINSLSEKQAAWLTRILDDCVERRIEGRSGAV